MEWQSGGGCCIYIFAFVRAKQKAAWVERGSAPPPSAPARTQQAVLVRTDVSLCGDGLKVGVKHAGDWERASKVPSNGECSVRRLTSLGTSGTIVRCSGASRATQIGHTLLSRHARVDGTAGLELWRSDAVCGRGVAVGEGMPRPEGKNDRDGGRGVGCWVEGVGEEPRLRAEGTPVNSKKAL